MSHHRVVWKEGLFVRPQHFQQETSFLERHLHQRLGAVSEFAYGFSELEINAEYLSFGKIALVRASGILPDGTAFDIPGGAAPIAPLTVDDTSAIGQVVHLALPLRSDGALEMQWPQAQAVRRYRVDTIDARDTHSPDGHYVPMEVARPSIQFLLDRDDRSAFTTIPMARIMDRRPDGRLLLDPTFYPTAVSVQAVPQLRRFLGEVAGLMRERAKTLAERLGTPSQAGVAEVADFNLLLALNRLQPAFQHLASLRQVHPERLYVALVAACGELVTFIDERRLPDDYPAYRHDDLRSSFKALEDTLRRCLSTVLQPRAVPLPVEVQRYGVRVAAVADRSLYDRADFVLAIKADLPGETLRQRFPLLAKVAAMEKLNDLVQVQLPGIPLIPLPVAPRYLPYHAGFTYYQLDRNSPAWAAMADSAGFGLHLAGDMPGFELQLWAVRGQ
jgi:type VI secretion system protein ImpJ